MREMLEQLCGAAGAGGLTAAAERAAEFLRQYTDDVSLDAMGNVVGIRRCGAAGAPLLLLEAHQDEIGFLVTQVDDGGFVHVGACGGVDARALAAAEVVIWAEKPILGVFCSTPPHLSGGQGDKLPEIPDMGIDTGLDAKKAKKRIRPGMRVTFRPNFRVLEGGRVTSKALDDRAGVAAVLHCLELLKEDKLQWDIAAVFAVQEELGCRGAAVAAFNAEPDRAIAVDVSFARTPDANPAKCGILGKGPMIGYAPGLDLVMTQVLAETAAEEKIPFQREVMGGDTGTDADSIAGAGAGVPTALLSIPLRYMHTPAEMVDLADVEAVGRLMAAYIRKEGAAQ